MDPTLNQLINTIVTGSPAGLIAIFVLGLYRGWWVMGPSHREIIEQHTAAEAKSLKERDAWMDLALKGTELARRASQVAERTVDKARDGPS